MMKVRMIEQRDNGVCLFELKNDEIKVITSNLGCHVLSVFTKDREGNFGDVVLGFENVEDCWHGDGSYMGAIAGRVANRIGDAKFELNGKTYELAANNGKNSLHVGRWNPFYLSLTRYGRRISGKSLSESCVSFMR